MSSPTTTEPDVAAVRHREAFVRNVRVVMARRSIKTAALAMRLGRPYAYVWHRVTGRTVPNLDDLATIADALEVPVGELVSLEEPTSTYIPGGAS